MLNLHRPSARFARLTLLSFVLALLALAPVGAARGDDGALDRWYTLTLNSERVGWANERWASNEAGDLITTMEMAFSIARGPITIELTVESEFVETPEGKPVRMTSAMNQQGVRSRSTYTWTDDGRVRIEERSAGPNRTRTVDAPGGTWLTPRQAAAYIEKRLEAGADTIVFAALDPSMGLEKILSKSQVQARETITVQGRDIEAVRWVVTQSVMKNIEILAWVDDKGRPIRTTIPLGGMQIEMEMADRATALAPFKAPELMVSTLIEIEGGISNPRELQRAVYRLTIANGTLPDLPTTGAQRVTQRDGRSAVLVVDHTSLVAAEADLDRGRYLRASAAADAEDPVIVELTARALAAMPADAGAEQRAEALRRFVYRFVNEKGLGVAMASASEVARNPEGDCTEHAVLLAAMLRAAGIPARAANGLIYADQFIGRSGVFGYHMWTQALIEREDGSAVWMDFDGAWPNRTDATHILVSVSALADDEAAGDELTATAMLLGNLSIEVLEPARAPAAEPVEQR